GGRGGAVVRLVGRGHAEHGEQFLRDGADRGREGGGRELVVGGVAPDQAEAGGGDGLVRADGLGVVGADGRRVEQDAVPREGAGQGVVGRGQGGEGGAVVGLRDPAREGGGDRSRGDGGGEAGRLGQAVVAAVGAGEGEAGGGHDLARAGVLVGEGAGGSRTVEGDRVPADHAAQARRPAVQGGRGGAVVRLVGRGHAQDREQLGRDGAGGVALEGDGVVVAGVAVGDSAGRGEGLAGARILGVEGLAEGARVAGGE
ncbi:MAG: hypothetical protein EBX50_19790, partial [Chitinophagia bacterium]|nr:hypothetical protein [Chitinophagia bacterium]